MQLAVVGVGVLLLVISAYVEGLAQVVKVCRNKRCCQNWKQQQSLVQVLQDLLDPDTTTIESTACLGACDHGPNIQVDGVLRQSIESPMEATMVLEEALHETVIPSVLLAAVNVMEQALTGTYQESRFFCVGLPY